MDHRNWRRYFRPLSLLGILLGLLVCSIETAYPADIREAEILVPVEPYKIPQGLMLVGPPFKEIELRVRGSRSAIENLSRNVPRYDLDLSGVAVGVESIPINPDIIKLPAEVKIIRINPAYLTVRVDRWKKKQVPVKVTVSGDPANSYFISATLAEPSRVSLCGPETVVSLIDQILTKPIDVTERSESFKKEIALELSAGVKVCSASGIVLAEITIAEKDIVRKFADVLVEGQNTPFEFSISPPSITVEIQGPQNIVENLQPQKDIQVRVELKNLSPGVYVRRATITLPVRTTLIRVEPELFTVKVIGDAE
jgi:YbbR-like protein